MPDKIDHFATTNLGKFAAVGAVAFVIAYGAFGAQRNNAPIPKVVRTGDQMIAEAVSVPAGYDTVYLSGQGWMPDPKSAPVEPGDTEAQSVIALEKIKATLAKLNMTLGDVVMMHAYLSPDPKTGLPDRKGWNAAYSRYFGTSDQPNKPARSTVVTGLVLPEMRIEVEVIAARPPKP